ncbi:MAG: 50S ribosomal protein L10 [Candidatus Thermoplasmatota archaeon]|nr:50S ribosomal protein L10 [Candidatus Thermoplasmatota archaeon]
MAETTVQTRKAQTVDELKARLLESRVVGLAKVSGIPAPQMQSIRSELRGKAELQVVKNRLLRRAIDAASEERKGIEGLQELVEGQIAVVFTDSNPFRLYRELEGTKTKAPARGGEVATEDIVVKEGDTRFKPGPVVGDLQKAGIPAAIERGKVIIKKDKLLVETGQRIPAKVAQVLTRLEIFPLTVGLDLRGVFEDGSLFTRDVLAVDEEALWQDMIAAARSAMNLAMKVAFPTKATLFLLLAQARQRALSLGLSTGYPVRELLPLLLSRAQSQMLALASRVPEALDDELKEHTASSPVEDEAPRKEKPPPKQEEKGEEDAAAGLGSLFG